jgi:hypothetical protein
MTMHASKGLEFDIVIIAGISDKIIPDRSTDIEEERRLFYVALTRAKEELHLLFHENSPDKLPQFIRELGYKKKYSSDSVYVLSLVFFDWSFNGHFTRLISRDLFIFWSILRRKIIHHYISSGNILNIHKLPPCSYNI